MSDSYEALIDCHATVADARRLAQQAIQVLSQNGLIVPNPSADCVFEGVGYPAGPQCAKAYAAENVGELTGNRFWALATSGVQIHSAPWVNVWGFTQFASAACPSCGQDRADEFLEDVGALVEDYLDTGVVPSVQCRSCHLAPSIHDWKCDPHLGFVTFALVFWNWPHFATEGWKVNVHALLEDHLKRPLVSTFGRM
jgi:hypothetical protein